MQNVINFTWLGNLLYMKIEPGPFICLSELLEFHVGLRKSTSNLKNFCGENANSEASVQPLVF